MFLNLPYIVSEMLLVSWNLMVALEIKYYVETNTVGNWAWFALT